MGLGLGLGCSGVRAFGLGCERARVPRVTFSLARKTCILLQSASSGLRLESAATTEPPGMQSENEPFSSMHACAAAVTSSQMFVSYAPSKMRTLLISLEMENSSMHPMRAAEARDTV